MALVPSTLGSAGPLSSDILDLQVTEHGLHARVVTVAGEIDALTAPKLGALLTAQLAVASLEWWTLKGSNSWGLPGCLCSFRPMNSRPGETATYGWCFPTVEWSAEL